MTNQLTDPLEILLQQAFASELTRNTDQTLMQQISRRIAREQRIRSLVLGFVGAAALVATFLILLPALGALAAILTLPPLPAIPPTATAAIAAVLIAPWLYALVDDPL